MTCKCFYTSINHDVSVQLLYKETRPHPPTTSSATQTRTSRVRACVCLQARACFEQFHILLQDALRVWREDTLNIIPGAKKEKK